MQWLGRSLGKVAKLDLAHIPVGEIGGDIESATATGWSSNLAGAAATMEFLLQPINRLGSATWPIIFNGFDSDFGY